MAGPSDHPVVTTPGADPLFVDTLRAGLEAYIRSDYRRAGDAFLDAAAIRGDRPEAEAWALLGVTLQHAVETGVLRSRDAAERPDQVVAR